LPKDRHEAGVVSRFGTDRAMRIERATTNGIGTGLRGAAPARALVAVAPAERVDATRLTRRPYAAASLVTHLLAVRDDAAQYREKRRATPAAAIAAYAAVSAAVRARPRLSLADLEA
jgi:hypothetical protein